MINHSKPTKKQQEPEEGEGGRTWLKEIGETAFDCIKAVNIENREREKRRIVRIILFEIGRFIAYRSSSQF